ncbi:DUF1932 domain-containing protein [Niallia oryzisoli]|uniref:DUF1932 domain-containing protein n=1 Tax=Niallia oryzisoli TaxID=1737571 RepID=A0ABZ2C703_9BACI
MMSNPRIGFIGFGEAAYHICKGLGSEGLTQIQAFDVMATDPIIGQRIRERAHLANVHLTMTLEDLVVKSSIIFCATSAKFALKIAEEVAQHMKEDQMYVDLNAASPKIKQEISSMVSKGAGLFVDGSVMDPVPPHGHRVPIYVSGSGASSLYALLQPFGMNITVINDQAGSSSAIKMVRSIFMKGFTSLLLETLTAAYKSGIEKEIIESINKTLSNQPIEELTNMLLTRTAIHAERRVSEMSEVIETIRESDLDDTMSRATKKKLQKLADLRLNEYFDYKSPDHFIKVLEAIFKQDIVQQSR